VVAVHARAAKHEATGYSPVSTNSSQYDPKNLFNLKFCKLFFIFLCDICMITISVTEHRSERKIMTTKLKPSPIDQLYKSLNKKKFTEIMANMNMVTCALSHLAYVCQEEKGIGRLMVPLIEHNDKSFRFQVIQNKNSLEQVLTVEAIDVGTQH
jgi:hypothetical protein